MQSTAFSVLFAAINFDKFIWAIEPRNTPYSIGRQLGLTCRWKGSEELPYNIL